MKLLPLAFVAALPSLSVAFYLDHLNPADKGHNPLSFVEHLGIGQIKTALEPPKKNKGPISTQLPKKTAVRELEELEEEWQVDDSVVQSEYQAWCAQYGRTPNEARYVSFKSNWILQAAYGKATGLFYTLNEYGDCSVAEYVRLLAPKLGNSLVVDESTAESSSVPAAASPVVASNNSPAAAAQDPSSPEEPENPMAAYDAALAAAAASSEKQKAAAAASSTPKQEEAPTSLPPYAFLSNETVTSEELQSQFFQALTKKATRQGRLKPQPDSMQQVTFNMPDASPSLWQTAADEHNTVLYQKAVEESKTTPQGYKTTFVQDYKHDRKEPTKTGPTPAPSYKTTFDPASYKNDNVKKAQKGGVSLNNSGQGQGYKTNFAETASTDAKKKATPPAQGYKTSFVRPATPETKKVVYTGEASTASPPPSASKKHTQSVPADPDLREPRPSSGQAKSYRPLNYFSLIDQDPAGKANYLRKQQRKNGNPRDGGSNAGVTPNDPL